VVECRRAEVGSAKGIVQSAGERRLHRVLQLHQVLRVSEELFDGVAPSLLLDSVLDVLPERVLQEILPTGARVRLVRQTELFMELTQQISVQLEVHGQLVRERHAVGSRRDDRILALNGADARTE